MAGETGSEGGLKYGRWATLGIGVAAFVVGMALLISVFGMAKDVFGSIDRQIGQVAAAGAIKSPAATAAGDNPTTGAVKARPGGPGVAAVAATLALKLLGLLVMGWIAAMIAARGASLAAGVVCPPRN